MRIRLAISLALGSAASVLLLRGVVVFSINESQSPPILYTAAKACNPSAWQRSEERFPFGAQIIVQDGAARRPLVRGFASSADPSVSFDGRSVLFAGKRTPTSAWQIWEVAAAGGEARRVTNISDDCIRPFYLPGDQLVYGRRLAGRYVIETASLSGDNSLQISHAPGNSIPTDILRDGRILFDAPYPLGSGAPPEIYTVYSDGSGVEAYRCDHANGRSSGRQVSSGDVVFTRGRGLARFTSALAHEVRLVAPEGEYAGDVAEMPSGEWILSWRADASASFVLKRWKSGTPTFATIASETGVDIVQPVVLAERTVPNRHPSGLHEWQTANLMALNVYTSKYSFAEGSVKAVRFYTIDPSGKQRVLGSAPVEKDGSFFVQVPGGQPLRVEMLDSAGRILKKQNGWMWAERGEQRICVGCHAGPEHAPENAVPAVLLKSTTPVDLTGSAGTGLKGGR